MAMTRPKGTNLKKQQSIKAWRIKQVKGGTGRFRDAAIGGRRAVPSCGSVSRETKTGDELPGAALRRRGQGKP
jgi:hypothetical protein